METPSTTTEPEVQKKAEEQTNDTNANQESTTDQQSADQDENAESELQEVMFPLWIETCGETKTIFTLQVNPTDNVQDIKQFLFDTLETCYITNYSLTLDDQLINDYSDLGDVENLQKDSVLKMKEVAYDERSIRQHVRRVRELLQTPVADSTNVVFSHLFEDPIETEESQKKNSKKTKEEVTSLTGDMFQSPDALPKLSEFYPQAPKTQEPSKALHSMVFSGWNPPNGNRKLQGDLIYLQVETVENKTYHITGSTMGFFLNSSSDNVFNPQPSKAKNMTTYSHNLVGLLNQLSPAFKKNFQALLEVSRSRHPFEMMPIPFPRPFWLSQKFVASSDLNKAEDALLLSSEADMRGQLRDWNEEYQSCKELPSETVQDRIVRDRAMVKIYADFVEAATKGAQAIVDGSVLPLNPLDPPRAQMFLFSNIFFSYALDGRDFFKDFGGDRAAHKSVNNDLAGIRAFNRADPKGLYTLATCVIDYRGRRLCAQSIIPGILQREQTSTVVYGSVDNGKKIAADPAFHALISSVGQKLHIRSHKIASIKEQPKSEKPEEASTEEKKENAEPEVVEKETVEICAPVECKGIVGTDGRKYVLDLLRVTPRDSNYSGKNHMFTVLRPELVAGYVEYLQLKAVQEIQTKNAEKAAEKQKLADAKSQEEKEKSAEVSEGKSETKDSQVDQTKPTAETTPSEAEPFPVIPPVLLNPNALCDLELMDSKEQIAEDEQNLKNAGSFLVEKLIPILIDEFSYMLTMPADGVTLCSIMHARGINIRYLGTVATLTKAKLPFIHTIAVREILVRCFKHLSREYLASCPSHLLGKLIAHLLNTVFGVDDSSVPVANNNNSSSKVDPAKKKKKKKAAKPQTQGTSKEESSTATTNDEPELKDNFFEECEKQIHEIAGFQLTRQTLYQKLKEEAQDRFGYSLPALDDKTQWSNYVLPILNNVQTLRGICGKIGVVLTVMDYDLMKINPFAVDDIAQILPVVKYCAPESHDGEYLLETGKVMLQQYRIEVAYELLMEALTLLHQVYGPMHPQTASCYSALASVLFHVKDYPQAFDYQQKAVVIFERVLGADAHETLQNYVTLAFIAHSFGKAKTTANFINRALYLSKLVSGINHPDIATVYTNMALMLQESKLFKEAILYLLEAIKCYEAHLGVNHVQTASLYHVVAVSYSQLGLFKEALTYEKKNYTIIVQQFGEKDVRAAEANVWMKEFTSLAVKAQKEQMKALQKDALSKEKLAQMKLDQQLKSLSSQKKGGPAFPKAKAPSSTSNNVNASSIQLEVPANIAEMSVDELANYVSQSKPSAKPTFSQRNQANSKFSSATGTPLQTVDPASLDAQPPSANLNKKKK